MKSDQEAELFGFKSDAPIRPPPEVNSDFRWRTMLYSRTLDMIPSTF